jgi:hypothetical protein
MTHDPTAALRLYGEAWAIPDYESRLELLRKIWADDGLYVDPDVPEGVRGPEALARTIDAQFELYPGISIVSSAQRGSHSPGSTSSSSPPTGESPG